MKFSSLPRIKQEVSESFGIITRVCDIDICVKTQAETHAGPRFEKKKRRNRASLMKKRILKKDVDQECERTPAFTVSMCTCRHVLMQTSAHTTHMHTCLREYELSVTHWKSRMSGACTSSYLDAKHIAAQPTSCRSSRDT